MGLSYWVYPIDQAVTVDDDGAWLQRLQLLGWGLVAGCFGPKNCCDHRLVY